MTPLAALLHRIGWTAAEFQRRSGLRWGRVRPWIEGKNSKGNPPVSGPPADVLAWLERVADAVEREAVPRV